MKGLALTILAAAMFAVTGVSSAQSMADPTNTTTTSAAQTIHGVVVTSSPTLLVVRTDAGREMSFKIDESSVLPVSSSIMPGSKINIEYHTIGTNEYHAAEVTAGLPLNTTPPVSTTPSTTLDRTDTNRTLDRTTANTTDTPRTTTSTDRTMANDMSTTRDRLPATASAWPAVFGWGFAALSGALLLRRVARSKSQTN